MVAAWDARMCTSSAVAFHQSPKSFANCQLPQLFLDQHQELEELACHALTRVTSCADEDMLL
jgi:hypothetical protein